MPAARSTLLELVADEAGRGGGAIGVEDARRVAQRKVLLYDKTGEEHFNLISALHKSLRESDPDAALYWLARMLEAGEEPELRGAPHGALRQRGRRARRSAGAAAGARGWESYERLGSPEGELALAQVAVYLALAPKSVAVYRAWGEARRAVEERAAEPVPLAIRNAPTALMTELGYGRDYVYAPDTAEGVAGLDCLPPSLHGVRFYRPSGQGFEERLQQRLAQFDELRAAARRGRSAAGDNEDESSGGGDR